MCMVALQLGDVVALALPPRRGLHDALVVDDAAPRPSRQLAEQYEREEWRGCARTPASEHPPPSLPLSPIARSVGWRALLAHRRNFTFCARIRRPKPLAGEEHQFQFLVFLLIMIVLGLIVVVACTLRFEKHCL